ncbi:MAG: 1,4-dihydroxy-2-naphthoate polyprenyltransferase [Actinomycetes bacterium]
MVTAAQWVQGARLGTLPAALAPVAAGTGAAAAVDGAVWWRALLALVVALALQVGVNYANDYSDGVRGTDQVRVGPLRLVGSGVASPAQVRRAALLSLAVAAVAGLALAAVSSWWLLLVGGAALVAAWSYTGGSRPYGYRGFGEIAVFIFFGLVAAVGTTYVQAGRVTWPSVAAGVGCGALACALLVANNLRDIETDTVAGKRTLAVLLGDRRTRGLYVGLLGLAFLPLPFLWPAGPVTAVTTVYPAVRAGRRLREGARGHDLVEVLQQTGLALLVYGTTLGLALGLTG